MLDSPNARFAGIGRWDDRLERCPKCSRDLVQAGSYEPLWGDRWLISLSCPNCSWEHEGVWPHAALRRFEEHLDDLDDQLWSELLTLEKTRMAEEIEQFAGALAADAIVPEDF